MREVGFAASIRTSSTEERSKSVGIRESFSAGNGKRGNRRRVFVFLRMARGKGGTSRTYNKLKSHHPRDLAAITRPSSPGDAVKPASVRSVVSRQPRRQNDDDDDRNNDGERARARARDDGGESE